MTTSPTAPLVEASGLSYSYAGPDGPVVVLEDVDFTVRRGEFVSILGPSGGGKSTLLNILGGLERPTAGVVRVDGDDITSMTPRALELFRQRRVAFIFQFFNLLPALTALENVQLGLEAMEDPPDGAWERASWYLERVGLAEKQDRYPSQLSGGEQQRVAIARALAKNAPLVLADEPTGNLDEDTAASVMDLIVGAQQEASSTLLLITHDHAVAARAGRVVELRKRKLHDATELVLARQS